MAPWQVEDTLATARREHAVLKIVQRIGDVVFSPRPCRLRGYTAMLVGRPPMLGGLDF